MNETILVTSPKCENDIRRGVLEKRVKADSTLKKAIVIEEQYEEVIADDNYIEKYFPLVKASTLSLRNKFLKHEPESDNQRNIKEMLVEAIKSGLSDFRVQRMDPTFDNDGRICYQKGKMPALGKPPIWWEENAKKIMPERESRLGTNKERVAFLGLLIKYLIEKEGYTVSEAWRAVCDQSKNLGHFYDSKDAKYRFESTGSRKIGEWYDLGNTCKIVIDNENLDFYSGGGYYCNNGNEYPLGIFEIIVNPKFHYFNFVGWIVISA